LGKYKLDYLYREQKNKAKVSEASISKKQGTSKARGKKKSKTKKLTNIGCKDCKYTCYLCLYIS
jgi:hypothetical protein